jgi:ATP-dependent protease ClpP protease subunit
MRRRDMKNEYWGRGSAEDDPYNGPESNENQVSVSNNRIYFYSEVTRPDCLTFNKSIQTLSDSLVAISHNYGVATPSINLHINSYGGSVFAGLSSVDSILDASCPTNSIVEGCAASAATIMSVVADKRYMRENSFMLIHQLSSGMWGKYEELKDDMRNNELLMETIKSIYAKHTEIPKKKLSDILKHDLWFDAKTCLEYGLVDEILSSKK